MKTMPAESPQSGQDTEAIQVYTDGACSGNPGPAGVGVIMEYKGKKREISEFLGRATNNIAELEAVRVALLVMKRKDIPIRLYTDSTYVHGMLCKGWNPTANGALVMELRNFMKQFQDIQIIKVPGHSGVPGNEEADKLATAAIKKARQEA